MNTTLYIFLIITIGGALYFTFSDSASERAAIPESTELQSTQQVYWMTREENDGTVLLLTTRIIPQNNINEYYAEYTLVNGRKICGQIGMPEPGGTFHTSVDFYKSIKSIIIYSDAEYYSQMNL